MYVLDASAVLAFLQGEPGSERVAAVMDQSIISAVNYSEVMAKLADKGVGTSDRRTIAEALTCIVSDFDTLQAEAAAALRPMSKSFCLSFADRACLALAQARDIPAVTADRVWGRLENDIKVELIR